MSAMIMAIIASRSMQLSTLSRYFHTSEKADSAFKQAVFKLQDIFVCSLRNDKFICVFNLQIFCLHLGLSFKSVQTLNRAPFFIRTVSLVFDLGQKFVSYIKKALLN